MNFYTPLVLLCFIINLIVAIAGFADEGYILLVEDDRVYIDLGIGSEASPGTIYRVYEVSDGAQIEVGRIQIIEAFEKGAAATIIDQQPGRRIQLGNQIALLSAANNKNRLSPSLASSQPFKPPKRGTSKTWSWLTLVSGVALGVGAIYSHERADDAYDLYKLAQTRDDAVLFERRTKRFDRNSQILMGTSIALATASVLVFLHKDPSETITTSKIDGQPYMAMVHVKW